MIEHASPHTGMDKLCPACQGPVPDLLGELTDEPAAINVGTRAVDCYYCGVPLISIGPGDLRIGPADPPPARRTAHKRDLKFGSPAGVDVWVAGVEKALEDEAKDPNRDPQLPPITKTKMVNKNGRRAFEGYTWYEPPQTQQANP
jgi:hypothetical protein